MTESQISARQVKELRDKTGAGMMDCKKALVDASGDTEKAVRMLREKGLARAKKRSERAAEQGLVESYVHLGSQIGSLVELNCETDFVARNSDFADLAHEIALQITACNPRYLDRESVPEDVTESKRAVYLEMCEVEDKPENVWDQIVTGMLEKYFQEVCLLEQPYVKDPSMSIGELVAQSSARLGEKIEIRRFCRYQVGEEQGNGE
jgi:elongation factor Ts